MYSHHYSHHRTRATLHGPHRRWTAPLRALRWLTFFSIKLILILAAVFLALPLFLAIRFKPTHPATGTFR